MAQSTPFYAYNLLWSTLDPDIKTYPLQEIPKKLANICAEKLVTDVLLVKRYCFKLPKSIHSLIFSTAVAKKRTLSIEQLMKFCPHETLEMPVPDILKSIHTVPDINKTSLEHELADFSRIPMTMLSIFFDLIKQNTNNSALQILDLGLFPIRKAALIKIHEFLFKQRAKISIFTRTYTLKCTVAIENSTDLSLLRACAEKSTSLGFDLDITGVYFYNDFFTDVETAKLFDSLKKPNLQLITFSFARLIPNFDLFFKELKYFKFVKYLNLSYLVNLLSLETDARMIIYRLAELTHLQRLVLKGIDLNGVLSGLLHECYKTYQSGISTPECCCIHSGSLCYLDISSCSLSDKDIEFLKELSVTNCLRYLDISENNLHEKRTFEILLFLKSSLQALNISSCFKHVIDYDDTVMPFSAFSKLKYLNIKGLQISENSKHLLECELQKVPNLKIIETNFPLSLIGIAVY